MEQRFSDEDAEAQAIKCPSQMAYITPMNTDEPADVAESHIPAYAHEPIRQMT